MQLRYCTRTSTAVRPAHPDPSLVMSLSCLEQFQVLSNKFMIHSILALCQHSSSSSSSSWTSSSLFSWEHKGLIGSRTV